MGNIRVAIDGPAGAGKSTVAKKVAQALDMMYVDTGAMYRAVTWGIIDEQINLGDERRLQQFLQQLCIHVRYDNDGKQRVWLNGKEISKQIRSPLVTDFVSSVSAHPSVRERLVQIQRELAKQDSVVMDGRDIGTVVFPDADVKLFITASPEVRALRRHRELLEQGYSADYEEVKEDIIRRDQLDSGRTIAPLQPAPDAIILDTSDMTLSEVVEHVIEIIRQAK